MDASACRVYANVASCSSWRSIRRCARPRSCQIALLVLLLGWVCPAVAETGTVDFDPPVEDLRKGRLVIGIVHGDDEESLKLAKKHAGERLVLVVLHDEPWTGVDAPRAVSPKKALKLLGAPGYPAMLVFEDGRLSRG